MVAFLHKKVQLSLTAPRNPCAKLALFQYTNSTASVFVQYLPKRYMVAVIVEQRQPHCPRPRAIFCDTA